MPIPKDTKEQPKVTTGQIGNRLFIVNGVDPMRYVDLTTNKVHQYKKPRFAWVTRILKRHAN